MNAIQRANNYQKFYESLYNANKHHIILIFTLKLQRLKILKHDVYKNRMKTLSLIFSNHYFSASSLQL